MGRLINKKLEMAARVQEWLRTHPPTDRNQIAIVERFTGLLEKAQSLQLEENAQRLASAAATGRRKAVRTELETQQLRAVARIGVFATRKELPAAARFTMPPRNVGLADFVVRAANVLDAAREQQEALVSHGLTKALLTASAAGLARLREAIAQEQASRQQHGATRAEFQRAVEEVNELVGLFDAFNLAQFAGDQRMLDLWRTVRAVTRSPRVKRATGGVAAEAPAAPGTSGPPSADEPAAGAAPPELREDHAA